MKKQFEKEMENFGKYSVDIPWEEKQFYTNWLAQTYYYSRHTTRLLMLGGSRFGFDQNSLHRRFGKHADEEKGHEKLVVNDLKGLGKSIDDLPEFPETAAFYKMQYYWIEHVAPLSFFGFILFLEGIAVYHGKKIYERAVTAHGDSSASFLKVHINEDVGHVEEAFNNLEGLSEEQEKMICQNMEEASRLYHLLVQRSALD